MTLLLLLIESAEDAIIAINFPSTLPPIQSIINTAVGNAVVASVELFNLSEKDALIPYGTFYTVSRAWSLNKPIYAFQNNEMSAANALYTCTEPFTFTNPSQKRILEIIVPMAAIERPENDIYKIN